MKKCGRCSKPAVLHITEIHDGEAQALHLCESCAKEYLSQPMESDVTNEDIEAMEAAEELEAEEPAIDEALPCPNCGITFKEFRSQGRLGCAHDYIHFRDELTRLIENIHGELQHVGKVPKRAPNASRRQFELIRLKSRLRDAVEDEQYETAARLRDEIRVIEAELHGAPPTATP